MTGVGMIDVATPLHENAPIELPPEEYVMN